MKENDVRRERLAWLRDNKFNGEAKALAEKIGTSQSQLGQWLSGHRTISPNSARRIEARCGCPRYWLDADSPGQVVTPPSPMAQKLASHFDEAIKDQQVQYEAFTKIMLLIDEFAMPPAPAATQAEQRPKTRRSART